MFLESTWWNIFYSIISKMCLSHTHDGSIVHTVLPSIVHTSIIFQPYEHNIPEDYITIFNIDTIWRSRPSYLRLVGLNSKLWSLLDNYLFHNSDNIALDLMIVVQNTISRHWYDTRICYLLTTHYLNSWDGYQSSICYVFTTAER